MTTRSQERRNWPRHAAAAAITAAVAAVLLLAAPRAWAIMRAEACTMEYQVRESDVILQGRCTDIQIAWSNKHIVTTYRIAVNKYFKAPATMTAASHPELLVSQLGGRLERPLPLEESYPDMVALTRNENVVLFLQSPDRVPAALKAKYDEGVRNGQIKPSPLMANFRLTAVNMSKMTVLTNPQTGAQTVARVNFDRYGMLPTSEAMQRFLDAYQAQQGYVDVKRGDQTVRIPVPVSKPSAPVAPTATMEEKIQHLQSYTAPINVFEQQVQEILSRPTGAAAPAAAGAK